MSSTTPPITFYVPTHMRPTDLSRGTDFAWAARPKGVDDWTLQTWHWLHEHGFPCQVVPELPPSGIVVAHRTLLPDTLRPGPRQLFVCQQADYARHPWAQLHVMQNGAQAKAYGRTRRDRMDRLVLGIPTPSCFIPIWPQPGLIPRDPRQGARFSEAAYLGRIRNLAPELRGPEWRRRLESLGFHWRLVEEPEQWQDYSDIDVVLAVRRFKHGSHLHKPASKLYNAWHAGVPAILGSDRAMQDERRGELDYIEVHSPDDVVAALARLREDPGLRRAMVENGWKRAEETRPERLITTWIDFLEGVAAPAWERWCRAGRVRRSLFFAGRRVFAQPRRLSKELRGPRSPDEVRRDFGVLPAPPDQP